MFNPAPARVTQIKIVLFLLCLIPLGRLVLYAFLERLGANPLEFITRSTGDWTLYLLCITLAITPLRRLTQWNWLIKLRRMLGLFVFFYGALHFTTFLWFDHDFDIETMLADVVKRPFITVGFAAFVLLVPLAVTSANRMVRWLGGKRWQWLHRLVYLIAPLGILHFWWMKAGKHDFAQPALFGLIIAILLGSRLMTRFARRQPVRTPVR